MRFSWDFLLNMLENDDSNLQTKVGVHITSNIFKKSNFKITGLHQLPHPGFQIIGHQASKILDYQSIIEVFSSFLRSWIIKSKNLDVYFDNPRFATYCTEQVENLG